jgi:hypothetical protein
MNSVQQGFHEVNYADPTETYCLQLIAKRLIFVAVENWRQTNALSGETGFLWKSDDNAERGFTGVTSFLWDRKVLSQATQL